MKKDNLSAAAILRQKAEELLRKNILETGSLFSDIDALKISHELEVYHIELQLQNDELMLAKSSAQDATEKYTELYDFAPSGYFTVSKEGNIIEINLCGSQMLGADRSRIKGSNFGFFVYDDTKPIFNLFLDKVIKSKVMENCEVTLSNNSNIPMYIHLTGIATKNGEKCLVTMVDITERKLVEEELTKSQMLLKSSIESPKDMIILSIDKQYKYLYFNTFHKDVMVSAYGADVKLGMNILDCISNDDDRKRSKINYDRALGGENHITIGEYGDLERHFYETRYNPIKNDKNEVIGATAFSADITGRKQTERALQEKMDELVLFHNLTVGRELKMIELKKEINELLRKSGQEEKYIIIE